MKSLFALTVASLLSLTSAVASAALVPFDQKQFDTALAAGVPIALDFHADWCPTCRAQEPVLQSLSQSPELKSLTVFVADFDKEKALRKSLHVTKQSTIIVFKDGREAARSTGETRPDGLSTLLHVVVH